MFKRTNDLLYAILEELKSVRKDLSSFKKEQSIILEPNFLNLPDHLRKTVLALVKLDGSACADEVAEITGRARAVESSYLNQLVIGGFLVKPPRKGRRKYFGLLLE